MARFSNKIRTAVRNPSLVPNLVAQRLKTSFCFHLSGLLNDWSAPPETVNIYPTSRCNLKCSMCFARYAESRNELGVADWEKIIMGLDRFRPRIHLSGGEPFVYPGIIELIKRIKKMNLMLHITTNGTMLTRYVQDLILHKVDRLDVSVDGPEERHDRIRGVRGAYRQLTEGLGSINKNRKKTNAPAVRINSIIDLDDLQPMLDLIKNAESWHAESIQFIYPLYLEPGEIAAHRTILEENFNLKVNYWKHADHYRPRPRDFEHSWRIIDRLKRTTSRVRIEIFPEFTKPQFFGFYEGKNGFYPLIQGRCRALWNTATILPSGDVESCPDFVIGHEPVEKFSRIWNNNIMRFLRRRIRDRRYFSVCRACCFFYR